MEPTKVTSSEFQQAFGALSDKARHEPVVITKHGRPLPRGDGGRRMGAAETARQTSRPDDRAGRGMGRGRPPGAAHLTPSARSLAPIAFAALLAIKIGFKRRTCLRIQCPIKEASKGPGGREIGPRPPRLPLAPFLEFPQPAVGAAGATARGRTLTLTSTS